MSFKLMKKWKKIVVYEFNVIFVFTFREWKIVLSRGERGNGEHLSQSQD